MSQRVQYKLYCIERIETFFCSSIAEMCRKCQANAENSIPPELSDGMTSFMDELWKISSNKARFWNYFFQFKKTVNLFFAY